MKNNLIKKIRILSLITIIFSLIGFSLTYALYSEESKGIESSFIKIKDTNIVVYENFTGLSKEDVDFTISSDIDTYIRVKLIFNYVDELGRILPDIPYKDIDYSLTLNNSWEYKDGYYYYPNPIKEGKTPVLIEEIHPLKDKYQLSLDILAQTSNSLSFN